MHFLSHWATSEGLMPRGFCYQWKPALIWLHAVSDFLIAVSYFSIPLALVRLARRKHNLPFDWMFVCFGIFIAACGITHLLEVATLWITAYWLSGGVKAITAAASLSTGALLVRFSPKILSIPSPEELRVANEELRKYSQNLLEQGVLIDLSQDAIIVRHFGGEIGSWNRGAEVLYGWKKDEVIGRSTHELLQTEFPMPLNEIEQEVQAAGFWTGEVRHRRRDGRQVIASSRWVLCEDSNGACARIMETNTDITDQRQAEEKLKRSEVRFRQMAENIKEIFWLLDPQTLEVVYVSPAFEDLCERPVSALYSDPTLYRTLIHPQDAARVRDVLAKLESTNRLDEEFRIICPSGATKWVHVHGFAAKDAAGEVVALVGTARDITSHRKMEAALRESEDRYRDLVEHSQDLICTHDLQGQLLSINERPARILGYSPAEILDTPMKEFLPPEAQPPFDEYLVKIRKDGFATGLLCVLSKSGERRIWEYRNTLRTEGVRTPIVRGIAHDVTDQKRAEKALRSSEEKFSKAFMSSPIDIAISTLAEGRFVDVNEAFERQMEFSRDEVIGHTSLELGMWVDPGLRFQIVGELQRGTRVKNYEVQFRTKSGDIRTKRYSAELIEISGEQCLLGVGEDVTEIRSAEKKLQLSEEKFAKAFRSSPNVMCISSLAEGRIIEVNAAFERHSGFAREDAIGHTAMELGLWVQVNWNGDPMDREKLIERILKCGRAQNLEVQFRRKSGRPMLMMLSLEVIELRREQCLLTVGQDITAQKGAEHALRQSEANYRSLFQSAPCGIFRAAPDGTFLDVNDALVEMLGYESAGELLSKNLENDIYEHSTERSHILETMLRHHTLKGVKIRWRRKDGSPLLVRASTRALRGESREVVRFETTVEDITLEEQFRQVQKMESLALLTGGIAHDFNNILAGVLGFGELLLRTLGQTDPRKAQVQSIVDAAFQGRSLTGQLLALIYDDALRVYPLNIDAEIRQTHDTVRRLIGEHIDVRTNLNCSSQKVLGERGALLRIILNLAVNARDAMPKGGRLRIRTLAAEVRADDTRHQGIPGGSYVVLSVSDTGCGMDKALQQRIFEPFLTTKAASMGTGLGLYAVRSIVRQCTGHIRIRSEVGCGSTFTIYFPIVEMSHPTLETVPEAHRRDTDGELIMIVEDDDRVREVLRLQLEDYGYRVLSEATPAAAISDSEALGQELKLLITDVVMPELNGPDLAQRLGQGRPNLKVLFTTGNAPAQILSAGALREGFELLRKPWTAQELGSTIWHLLAS